MSIFSLSTVRNLGGIFGILQLSSLLVLLLLLFKAVHFYLSRKWLLKTFQQFPSAPSHWLFGHNLKDEELQHFLTWVKRFPAACSQWLWGNKARILIYDPDYVKVILGRSDPKAPGIYNLLVPWIGYGLLLLNGQKWFQHRRMLTPAFHYDILKPYVGIMANSVHVMLNKLEQFVDQDSSVEILQHVSLMTLETIMKCAFSHHGNVQLDGNSSSYIKAIEDLNSLAFFRIRNAFYHNDTIYSLSSDGRLSHRACKLAHEHTEKVIKLRKAQLQDEGVLENVKKKRHLDFLDILLFAKDGLHFRDLLDQMPYTTMCIKEALRLYPPVPSVSRKLNTPVTFPDGRSLPKGVTVTLSFYTLHHNPDVWPNPQVFDPSRFAPDAARHSHAFLPFSGGSRNCIGKQFAMNEMKVTVALTLLHFELLPDPTRIPVPMSRLVLRSKNGIHLRLKKLQ